MNFQMAKTACGATQDEKIKTEMNLFYFMAARIA
jgi:hypothetical protein